MSWIGSGKLAMPVILALGVVLLSGVAAQSADRATLRVDVFFHGPHAPFFLGIEKGFYKEENIDLKLEPGTGSGTTIKLVGNKSDTFGYADAGTMIKAVAEGVPVRMIMGILQKNPMTIVSLKESGIAGPKDLPGKRMAGTPGSSPEQMFPAFCKANKIDCSNISMVQVDIPTKSAALLAKRVDATFVYLVTQVPMLEDTVGGPINTIRYAEHGVNLLSNGLITHSDLIKTNPDLVRRFVRASVKSWKYALDHPDETVTAFGRESKTPKPSVVQKQLHFTFQLLETERIKGRPLGWMSAEDWTDTVRFLEDYGDLKRGLKPEQFFTNEFIVAK